MAVPPEIDIKPAETMMKSNATVKKKWRHRRNKNKNQTVESDCTTVTASEASSSSAESTISSLNATSKQRRQQKRRKKGKKKSNNKNKTNNQQIEETLTAEEMSQYVAMDCEMVGAGYKGQKSIVARVIMIDWNGSVLLDEYVKPTRPVTDYRTFISGITPQHLEEEATLDIDECRCKVTEILEDKILIGHALKNDLRALNISHPWWRTRDTAKYEPFMKTRFNDGILWPRKLKDLVEEKLQRSIQPAGQPHSAYEDSVAAFDLYRLVRRKWEKAMDYKIKRTKEIESDKGKQDLLQFMNSETESD